MVAPLNISVLNYSSIFSFSILSAINGEIVQGSELLESQRREEGLEKRALEISGILSNFTWTVVRHDPI